MRLRLKHSRRTGAPPREGLTALVPLVARAGRTRMGRACPLCPGISDVNLFRYRKRIIDFDAEVSDGAFDFGVA
jgi:hypothetical protein